MSLSFFLFSAVLAVTNPQPWSDVTNSATLLDSTVTTPVLRAPVADSYTNNLFEQFSFTRSTSGTGVSHYTLYIDNLINASYITHANEQNSSLYTASVDDNNVYLTFKSPLSQGEHSWYVIAYGSQGRSAKSETKNFTVDSTTPIIILQAADKNTFYWASNDPSTIPLFDKRQLIVTTKNPLLVGKVEAGANLKLSLCRPAADIEPASGLQSLVPVQTVRSLLCTSIIVNDPDGEWQHRFYNLKPNLVYSVYLSATDTAGNSNIFPEFTIRYTPAPIRPAAEIVRLFGLQKPVPSPSPPKVSPGVGPDSPGVTDTIPPPPPPPLPAQVLPPQKLGGPVIPAQAGIYIILSLFGLIIHLSMTAFGASVRFLSLPKFLILIFNPFVKLNLKTPPTTLKRLRHFSLTTRSIPLAVSLISAIIYLVKIPTFPALILLIAGVDLVYTQYLRTQSNSLEA